MPRQPRISQEERRARDAERKRTQRRNTAASTDAEVVARREHTRQRLADQRRLRRLRQRSDVPPADSLPPPHFLPLHQRQAMDDYFDRILRIRFSLAECETCLERYHGMKTHNAQCDRCRREVSGL